MSTQRIESDVQTLKADMQDVKDILREMARHGEETDRRLAEMARLGEETNRRIENISRDVELLVKAVETIHGDIHREYGQGPSGRSDDWPGK